MENRSMTRLDLKFRDLSKAPKLGEQSDAKIFEEIKELDVENYLEMSLMEDLMKFDSLHTFFVCH